MSDLLPPLHEGNTRPRVEPGGVAVLRHLEHIDLLLQRYIYLRADYGWQGEVVLSMLDIERRLADPQGKPAWLEREEHERFKALAMLDIDPQERLGQLMARFELNAFEAQVLLLGALPHLDNRYQHLLSSIQGKGQSLPTLELAMQLFCSNWLEKQAALRCLQPKAPLFACRLVQTPVDSFAAQAGWGGTPMLTNADVWHFLMGDSTRLPAMGRWGDWLAAREGIVLSDGEQALRNVLESFVQTRRPAVLMLKRVRAEQVARVLESLSFRTLALALASLPQDDEAALDACRCALRNARMYGAALLIQHLEELQNSRAALLEHLAPLLASAEVPLIALEERHAATIRLPGIAQVTYELPALSAQERAEALSQWIDRNEPVDVLGLSRRFSFAPEELADIHHEAAFYQQQRARGKAVSQQAWMQALGQRARQNFGNLAQRVKPQRELDDLIISADLHRQLTEILAAIRHREARLEQGFQHKVQYGTGISALFYGPSGTGKTMAAEVLAKTIQLDLIKIDLSAVVNKYIGETEKNLARIFDLAEADAGVLFFDEADALFGKRSEVKDAHDRHANIEVSYLLQRLESYPGLVILATNNRAHMDEAFIRRFTFVTRFLFPDAALRERMWRAIWPDEIRVDNGVDFADLARRIEVTGASIRNIALLASWLAHAEGTNAVMARHLEQASLRELAKAGRLKI